MFDIHPSQARYNRRTSVIKGLIKRLKAAGIKTPAAWQGIGTAMALLDEWVFYCFFNDAATTEFYTAIHGVTQHLRKA